MLQFFKALFIKLVCKISIFITIIWYISNYDNMLDVFELLNIIMTLYIKYTKKSISPQFQSIINTKQLNYFFVSTFIWRLHIKSYKTKSCCKGFVKIN